MDEDESPCVGICIIGEDGRCVGCGRTEAEIRGEPDGEEDEGEALTTPPRTG